MPIILQLPEIMEMTGIKTYVNENKKYESVDCLQLRKKNFFLMNYVFLLRLFHVTEYMERTVN